MKYSSILEFGATWNSVVFENLLQDLFPFYRCRSLTTCLLLAHILSLFAQLGSVGLNPLPWPSQSNLFEWMLRGGTGAIIIGRFVSECQQNLGVGGTAFLLGCLQVVRVCGTVTVSLAYPWLLTTTPTLYAIHILELIDLSKWRHEPPTFPAPVSIYPQQDLLDLNQTVIKLTPSHDPHPFLYESYTNRAFYQHNVCPHSLPAPTKHSPHKRYPPIPSPPIDVLTEEDVPLGKGVGEWYKAGLRQLLLYALLPWEQNLILLAGQIVIYTVVRMKGR